MGFRVNKKINYTKKDKNTFRAIAIGASTTEEEGLDQNKIWTNLLIKKIELKKKDIYENFEMINMGVGGLRAIHHYFSLVRNLKLNPDLVIFLIGINDWNYHIMQRNRKFTFQYYEYNFDFKKSLIFELSRKIKKSLKKKLFKYNHISTTVDNKNFNYYEDLIIKNTRNKNKSTNIINFSPTYVYYEYEFWLNAIINTCKKNNINCIFVDQPSLYNIKTKTNLMKFLWMNPPFVNYKINFSDNINIANLYNEYLSKEIRKNNLNFCKISDKIYPDMINFIDDVHFTPVGSELVAKSIFNCMNNK